MGECVFQKTGRANGKRRVDAGDERAQVAHELRRQLRLLECQSDAVVGVVPERARVDPVSLHEAVEEFRSENGERRNGDLEIGELVGRDARQNLLADQVEAGGLAAVLTLTDTRERLVRA